jgi:hypothetical protein
LEPLEYEAELSSSRVGKRRGGERLPELLEFTNCGVNGATLGKIRVCIFGHLPHSSPEYGPYEDVDIQD